MSQTLSWLHRAEKSDSNVTITLRSKIKDTGVLFRALDVESDFTHNYGDNITVVIGMARGDFMYDFLPYKEDLNVTISINNEKILFMAVLDQLPASATIDVYSRMTREELNKDVMDIKLQLIDIQLLALNASSSNGTFNNTDVEGVINTVFSEDAYDVSNVTQFKPLGLNITKPDNGYVYSHVDLHMEKKLLKIPFFLQKEYGVYNGGLNTYKTSFHKDNKLFIFPPYVASSYTVNLYVLNEPGMHNVKDNYLYKDGVHYIAVTSSIDVDLDSSKNYSKPPSISTASPRHIGGNRVKDGKVEEGSVTRRLAHEQPLHNSLTPFNELKVTDNIFDLSSEVTVNQFYIKQLKWSGSNLFMFKPGMGVVIIDEGKSIQCILVQVYTAIELYGSGTILTVAIKRDNETSNKTSFKRIR